MQGALLAREERRDTPPATAAFGRVFKGCGFEFWHDMRCAQVEGNSCVSEKLEG